jgi:hypothetical protein
VLLNLGRQNAETDRPSSMKPTTVRTYRYEKMGQRIVRIKRFSGEAEILRVDGWKPMKPRVPEGFRELGPDEKILPLEPPAPGGTVDR